ncbi:hypothetical protein C9374_013016 [Naegleria lovaniensis]|uniref:Myb-like DNA-binding domain containing protein n=1 Tax=Naegleria lovaniensis TaxID=51637 RepID=A0AA88GBU5_NAELO|nr:uncharacterized protein C9374_013016 [Naegleria lovaniensis]KAG2372894.1 hypothetical protein C9374_013016 [Naegleria lovaniensis]
MVEKKASSRKNSNGSSLFTAEDDQKLIEGYKKYGNNWKDISREYFNGRFKTNQLFQRYKRVLVAKDKESTWSKNEDIELLSVYHHFEGSWIQMSKKYYKDTRTDNQLSNRWASLKKSCCLIDTFSKLKPNIKKDLYTFYKKARKTTGPDSIRETNFTEIVEIPEEAFPKIYLGEGRRVQKESSSKKRKTAPKRELPTESSTKKRKTSFIVEDDEDDSSSSEDEDEVSTNEDIAMLPRTTRGQRVNYSKMLSDEGEDDTATNEDDEYVPKEEEEEAVVLPLPAQKQQQPQASYYHPLSQLSKQQVEWLQAQKCPSKRSSSSTAPVLVTNSVDLACDEDIVAPQQVFVQPQQPVMVKMEKQIQYTVVDNRDVNLNFNEEECLEIERFLGAPYSNFETERNYSMEDILAQTRIIKEFLEQSKTIKPQEENPFTAIHDDFCAEACNNDMFDFSTFNRAPKSPLLFDDDLDFL